MSNLRELVDQAAAHRRLPARTVWVWVLEGILDERDGSDLSLHVTTPDNLKPGVNQENQREDGKQFIAGVLENTKNYGFDPANHPIMQRMKVDNGEFSRWFRRAHRQHQDKNNPNPNKKPEEVMKQTFDTLLKRGKRYKTLVQAHREVLRHLGMREDRRGYMYDSFRRAIKGCPIG